VDGEVVGSTPVDIEIEPGSLVVLAPLPDTAADRERAVQALRAELKRLEDYVQGESFDPNKDAIVCNRIEAIRRELPSGAEAQSQ